MTRTYDDTMFIDSFEHEYTWLNGFMRNVRRYSKKTAILDPQQNKKWTYEQLNQDANRLAAALQKDGIKKDDVVMTALRNSPAFALTYVSPRKIGAILLAANFNLSAGEMALLIDFNKPKIIIYSANIAQMIVDAVEKANFKPQKCILADNIENVEIPQNHISLEDYMKDASPEEPKIDFRPHIYDEVLRLCTSGTTSLPKCVPINDINEVLSAHDVIMHYPLNANDITLNMTPWFHRGGCHCAGPGPIFYVGGAVVVMRKFQPQTALDWVAKYGITFLMGAPANLAMLSKGQENTKRNLASLRGIVTMGAPLSKSDCTRFFETLTPNIYNGYGTTETFWNSFLRPYMLPENAGSVGLSCIDDEVRVVKLYDDKKAEPDEMVAHDSTETGEIIIRSPAKSTYSYYNNPEQTKQKFYKGWMYTGDTGTWDKDWIITISGRKDDMMIVSGENIYPTQIEEVLNEHPKVKDSIVSSVPDKIRGQSVVAYVVASDSSLTIKELYDFCANSEMLSRYKRPRYFAIIDEIPFNATGKKLHFVIKQRALKDLESGILRKN